jgi:hypothetical protein
MKFFFFFLHLPGKRSSTELNPQPPVKFFKINLETFLKIYSVECPQI